MAWPFWWTPKGAFVAGNINDPTGSSDAIALNQVSELRDPGLRVYSYALRRAFSRSGRNPTSWTRLQTARHRKLFFSGPLYQKFVLVHVVRIDLAQYGENTELGLRLIVLIPKRDVLH